MPPRRHVGFRSDTGDAFAIHEHVKRFAIVHAVDTETVTTHKLAQVFIKTPDGVHAVFAMIPVRKIFAREIVIFPDFQFAAGHARLFEYRNFETAVREFTRRL